jgi:hypothetical protein
MAWEQVNEALEYAPYCGSVSLATKLHTLVKLHTDGTVLIGAAATDKLVGVLREENIVGKPVTVQFGGVAKVLAGGTIAPGDLITSDGSGAGIATTTPGNRFVGIALEPADANDIFPMMIQMGLI